MKNSFTIKVTSKLHNALQRNNYNNKSFNLDSASETAKH